MTPYHFPDDGPIAFRRERDLGDVIRATMLFLKETAREWIPPVLLFAGPFYVLSAVLEAVWPTGLGNIADTAAGVLLTASALGYVRLYREGEPRVSLREVWAEASQWFGAVFVFNLVSGIVGLLILAPVVLLIVAAFDAGSSGMVMVGALGAVLALVLLAVLLPYYAVGLAARVLEADDLGDAYRRAAQLIKPYRGFATGTTLVIFLLVGFLVLVLGGSLGAAFEIFGTSAAVAAVSMLALVVVLIPASVFATVAPVFLYESLVERAEGTQLDAEIDAIRDGAPEPAAPAVTAPATRADHLDEPDRRSFAERLADPDATPARDLDAPSEGAEGGFRGGGFRDAG